MSKSHKTPKIPLPKGWKTHARSAVLHVLSLAQYAAVYTRNWAADGVNTRARLKAELDRVNQELLLLRAAARPIFSWVIAKRCRPTLLWQHIPRLLSSQQGVSEMDASSPRSAVVLFKRKEAGIQSARSA